MTVPFEINSQMSRAEMMGRLIHILPQIQNGNTCIAYSYDGREMNIRADILLRQVAIDRADYFNGGHHEGERYGHKAEYDAMVRVIETMGTVNMAAMDLKVDVDFETRTEPGPGQCPLPPRVGQNQREGAVIGG